MQKLAVYLLLAVGVSLILQPWWSERLQEKQQLKLLTHWDQWQETEQREDHDHTLPAPLSFYSGSVSEPTTQPAVSSEALAPSSASFKPITIDGFIVKGTISIETLDLREPILDGATENTLQVGIGIVEVERKPGETGNFVLAGHNSRTAGKHFNRIHELQAGDRIVIAAERSSYIYAVTDQFVVEPDDLSVLAQTGESSELTLITCDKVVNPTHRLIVKAQLQSKLTS